MESKKPIEEIMEEMEVPEVAVDKHQKIYRLTLLNTRKSTWAGVVLLILPFLFITGVIFGHYLELSIPLFTSVYDWIGELDQKYGDESILNWIIRLLLLLGPAAAALLNLLAVSHARFERPSREFVFSFKLKWQNWAIIIVCSVFTVIFFLYTVLENAG